MRRYEEEKVELLSKVDIFESLLMKEIRELLDDLLRQNSEIRLQQGEVFYSPWEHMAPHSSQKVICAGGGGGDTD